jgi:ribulose-phosphate 3-epimerase
MITQISVSILGLDYSDQSVIDQAVMRITNANYVHFDVCDGKFVKQKSFGAELVKNTSLAGTKLGKDVHLMVKNPEKRVGKFIAAGAGMISFHFEAAKNPLKLIRAIQGSGVLAGIAINPQTPVKKVDKLLAAADYVLVMCVRPGRPGQKLLKPTIKKVKGLRKKYPGLIIEVDGGINGKNAGELIIAGASILVSGSFIFATKDPKLSIDLLRNA